MPYPCWPFATLRPSESHWWKPATYVGVGSGTLPSLYAAKCCAAISIEFPKLRPRNWAAKVSARFQSSPVTSAATDSDSCSWRASSLASRAARPRT